MGNIAASIDLDQLLDISKQAAAAILDIYATGFDVEEKDDQSPVTTADLRAHEIIMAALPALNPSVPIVSEEDTDSIDPSWTTFWLVDPLDGTRHFIKRDGEFTVNIALIENGVPTLGLVHVPVQHQVYLGVNDAAYVIDDRRDVTFANGTNGAGKADAIMSNVATRAAGAHVAAVLSTSETAKFVDTMSVNTKALTGCETVAAVRAGSALKFCTVATGEADVYPRLQGSYLWDVAAGDAVLRAAGGGVRRLDGSAFVYDLHELLNPPFVAFGDTRFAWWDAVPAP